MQALKKLPGVGSAVVDFKSGKVDLAWKEGKRFDYEAVRRVTAKTANLTLRAIEITVAGEIERKGEETRLKATGTGDWFILKDLPATPEPGPLEVSGKLELPPGTRQGKRERGKTDAQPLTLRVEAHRPLIPSH